MVCFPDHSLPSCFGGFLGVVHKLLSRLCYLRPSLAANLKCITNLDEMICWPHTFTHTCYLFFLALLHLGGLERASELGLCSSAVLHVSSKF